jgi:hypothetical protein
MHCAVLPAPIQIDSAGDRNAFGLLSCAVAIHRMARAIILTTISNAAKAKVSASRRSVWTSDLYIAAPSIGRNPTTVTVREAKGFIEALKLASIGNLRGRTRDKSVIAELCE